MGMVEQGLAARFAAAYRPLEAAAGRELAGLLLRQAGISSGAALARTFKPLAGDEAVLLAWPASLVALDAVGLGELEMESLTWPGGPIRIRASQTLEMQALPLLGLLDSPDFPDSETLEGPFCAYTAGVLAGLAGGFSGRPGWICAERTCRAQGRSACSFELRPAVAAGPWATPVLDPWFSLDPRFDWVGAAWAQQPVGLAWFNMELRLCGHDEIWKPWLFSLEGLPQGTGFGARLRTALEQVRAGESVRLECEGDSPAVQVQPLMVGETVVGVAALLLAPPHSMPETGPAQAPVDRQAPTSCASDPWRRKKLAAQNRVSGSTARVRDVLLGDHAALAVENARLHAEALRRADELQTLFAVHQALTSRLDPDAVLQLIAEEAQRLTGAHRAVVFLLQGEALVISFVAGESRPGLIGQMLEVKTSLTGKSVLTQEPLLLADIDHDPRVPDPAMTFPYKSQISIPLWSAGEPLGAIAISDRRAGQFDSNDVRLMTLLASSAVIALENARLYREEQERRREADRHRRVAEGLRDILAVLNARRSMVDVLDYIVGQARQLLDAGAGVIYRGMPDGQFLMIEAASGAPESLLTLGTLPFSMEMVNQAILNGQAYAVSELPLEVSTDLPMEAGALDSALVAWKQVVRSNYRAYLAIPLTIRGALYGALVLYYPQPREFSPEDIDLGMALGGQVALAMESVQLYAETGRRADEIRTLFAVQQAITSRLDPDAVLQLIADEARRLTDTEQGAVYLLQGDQLVVSVVSGAMDPALLGVRLQVAESAAGLALQSGRPVLVTDVQTDLRGDREFIRRIGAQAFAVVPLLTGSGPRGTITVANKRTGSLGPDDERVLTVLASSAVIGLENAQLYREAQERTRELERRRQVAEGLRDILTIINSDRSLPEVLDYMVSQARELLSASATMIRRGDWERQTVLTEASCGLPPDFAVLRLTRLHHSTGDRTLMARRPVVVPDLQATMGPALAEPMEDAALRAALEVTLKYYRSYLAVPLFIREQIYGSLTFYYAEARQFSDEEVRLAVMLGDQVALAIENARLYQETRRRLAESQSLQRVTAALLKTLRLEELLQIVCDEAQQLTGATASVVFLADAERRLQVALSTGVTPALDAALLQSPLLQASLVGLAVDSGMPMLSNDPGEDPWAIRLNPPPTAVLIVPLRLQETVVGALAVFNRPEGFTEEEIRIMELFADQAAIAIESARLRAEAEQAAVVAERNRLARDLHDAVTQTLFSASLIADVLPRLWERNPAEGQRRLAELRELTRGALAEMRTLLVELRPSALVEAELGDLLRQLAEAMVGRARIPVTVQVDGQRGLAPDVQVALYRIAQEALNNVVKHAGAGQVQITLQLTSQQVTLEIVDDGCGFDPGMISREHLGVGIMRERAETVGARLLIDSCPGQGTRVSAVWNGLNA